MAKIIVFHYDSRLRTAIADRLRNEGNIVYNAADTVRALEAITALRPDIVITDFPAYLPPSRSEHPTLTEAIRAEPGLAHVAIVNIRAHLTGGTRDYARSAGVTMSIPADMAESEISVAIQHLCPEAQKSG